MMETSIEHEWRQREWEYLLIRSGFISQLRIFFIILSRITLHENQPEHFSAAVDSIVCNKAL